MDYKKLAEQRTRQNRFARQIGCTITEIREGYSRVEMPINENHLNTINSIHGGCLYTIADVAGGAAAVSYGEMATTINSSFQYLRAGINTTKLIAEATGIKHGKRIMVFNINVMDQDGTVLCSGTFSFMGIGQPVVIE